MKRVLKSKEKKEIYVIISLYTHTHAHTNNEEGERRGDVDLLDLRKAYTLVHLTLISPTHATSLAGHAHTCTRAR